MFLQLPEYRHEFVHDTNIYYMLLRALLIFHQHSVLKTDCSIILFMLAFGEHCLGSYSVSVPNICAKLKVPFVCEYHGKESQFNKKSDIEILLLNSERGDISDRHSNNGSDTDRSHMSAKLKTMWQYVRLQFADLWFGGIEHISIDFTCSADKDLSVVYSSVDNYPDAMAFDKRLALTKADLKLIQATNISYVFKYWLNTISNATRHSDVTKALSAISNNLFSAGICKNELSVGTITTTLMRFYASTPNTAMDELIFVELLSFFENLIRNGTPVIPSTVLLMYWPSLSHLKITMNSCTGCWRNSRRRIVFSSIYCNRQAVPRSATHPIVGSLGLLLSMQSTVIVTTSELLWWPIYRRFETRRKKRTFWIKCSRWLCHYWTAHSKRATLVCLQSLCWTKNTF